MSGCPIISRYSFRLWLLNWCRCCPTDIRFPFSRSPMFSRRASEVRNIRFYIIRRVQVQLGHKLADHTTHTSETLCKLYTSNFVQSCIKYPKAKRKSNLPSWKMTLVKVKIANYGYICVSMGVYVCAGK